MQGVPDHSRLVSGELIPAGQGAQTARPGADPVLAERPCSADHHENQTPERRKAGPLLFWSTCLLAVFLAFWMAGGHRLVLEPLAATIRSAPAQALQIQNVTSRLQNAGGNSHLLVEGAVRNYGTDALAVPPITMTVTGNGGATTRYYLETDRTPLAPGAEYGFSSRLDAPPNGVASVSITFQEGSR